MNDSESKMIRNLRGQRGTIIVLVSVFLIIIVGLAALTIDFSHRHVVRNELQNAVDAAALAGANQLYPPDPDGSNEPRPPDWEAAESTAIAAISDNKSSGVTLEDVQVQTGYWNLNQSPAGLQSRNITPGNSDVPAVMVLVSRSDGQNTGPVATFFAFIDSLTVRAEAVAVKGSPGEAKPSALFPIAISKEIADQMSDHQSPETAVIIGSSYHYPTSMAGQWTSLFTGNNDVTTMRELIAYGNPETVGVGDQIWVEPGVKNTLYGDVRDGYKLDGNNIESYIGKTVFLPVVDAILNDETHSMVTVYSFVGFHITDAVGGADKYVQGYFTYDNYGGLLTGPGGPNYGVYAPPVLVN